MRDSFETRCLRGACGASEQRWPAGSLINWYGAEEKVLGLREDWESPSSPREVGAPTECVRSKQRGGQGRALRDTNVEGMDKRGGRGVVGGAERSGSRGVGKQRQL